MRTRLMLLSVLVLGACGDTQNAAYLIAGGQHSLTLTRQQAFVGSDWDTQLVVARFPDCQRRYPLAAVSGDQIRVDVYRTEPGVFILNSGKRWYVTETQTCRFEQFKEPPPAPGALIGSFQARDGKLEYKDQGAPKAPGTVSTAPPPAARP